MGLWNLPWWWHPSVPLSRFLVTKHFVLVPALFNRSASSTDKASRELNSRAFSITFSLQASHLFWPLVSFIWEVTDAEAEAPVLWPPDAKNWLTGKHPDARKDWRQEEKGMTEDEMVGWQHRLNRHEFEQAPGVGDGQGNQACCSPWGRKESDMIARLNWTELQMIKGILPTPRVFRNEVRYKMFKNYTRGWYFHDQCYKIKWILLLKQSKIKIIY